MDLLYTMSVSRYEFRENRLCDSHGSPTDTNELVPLRSIFIDKFLVKVCVGALHIITFSISDFHENPFIESHALRISFRALLSVFIVHFELNSA